MKVISVNPRGYCHGVVTAMTMARNLAKESKDPLYMLGYLVHNEHMTDELADLGIELIDSDDRLEGLDEIRDGTVIFTAHGVSPAVRDKVKNKGLMAVDTTCSDVQVTHDLIVDLVETGYDIVYVGRRGHPEAEGCLGEAPDRVHLVEKPQDVDRLELESSKVAVTTQTTLSIWDTADTIRAVRNKFPHVEIYNEICRATQDRQEAVIEAAAEADVVIVVGSERSSNSNRLVDVARTVAEKPAYLVDTVDDLQDEWFQNVGSVAVTSGASTPSRLTREVISALTEWGRK